MDNLTVVIPYYNESLALQRLLDCLPADLPLIVVDDHSDVALAQLPRRFTNARIIKPAFKGYFTGAVNMGITACETDVLVLNQDITLQGDQWLTLLADKRSEYALIGERIKGDHPAFPHGYVHGVFQFMRRDAITKAGKLDEDLYPLWGASALWQWQIARKGYKSLPLPEIPGLWHEPRQAGTFGKSITHLLRQQPSLRSQMIKTPPLVSVVIPCYNYSRYLEDAINSLIGGPTSLGQMPGQSMQSFEIVIVNDGSDAPNTKLAQTYADPWKGIRVLHKANGGTASANNLGIRNAVGAYITIMAADDMREPWSLAALLELAQNNPKHFVYDELTDFAKGKRTGPRRLRPYDCTELPYKNMVPAGILFPKRAWQEAGGYPEQMIYGREDWAFNISLALRGWQGIKLNRQGYLYRREGQNRSLTNGSMQEHFLTQLAQVFPDVYTGENMCCGEDKRVTRSNARSRAPMFDANSIPGGMTLLQYNGSNVGNQTWGGPGTVPTGRYYVFGNNPKDKVRYVDQRDVPYFLGRNENNKPLFSLYKAPVAQPIDLGELVPNPQEQQPQEQPALEIVGENTQQAPLQPEALTVDWRQSIPANVINPKTVIQPKPPASKNKGGRPKGKK